jgi:hypothetical protein
MGLGLDFLKGWFESRNKERPLSTDGIEGMNRNQIVQEWPVYWQIYFGEIDSGQ